MASTHSLPSPFRCDDKTVSRQMSPGGEPPWEPAEEMDGPGGQGASGIGGRSGTMESQMPREGLERVGMATGCREAEERAGKGQEAATLATVWPERGFLGRMVCGVWSERHRAGRAGAADTLGPYGCEGEHVWAGVAL